MTRNLAAIAVACGALFACGGTQAADHATDDLVVTGGARPVRIRLDLRCGEGPWREHYAAARSAWLRGLLSQLDGDGDKRLQPAEAARTPRPVQIIDGQRADEVHVAYSFRFLDGDSDGSVDLRELQAYYDYFGDLPMQIVTAKPASTGDSLFSRLDADGNGTISSTELERTADIFALDLDQNEVLTDDELRPRRVVSGREFIARPSRRPTAAAVSAGPLEVQFAAGPGGPADVVVSLDLLDPALWVAPDGTRIDVTGDRDVVLEPASRGGTAVLRLFGRRIELRVEPPALRGAEHAAQALHREFAAADADGDGQVPFSKDLGEFLRESFGVIDHDGDGTATHPELTRYIDDFLPLAAAVESARLSITFHGEVRGLLAYLDSNRDGRLGARELRGMRAAVAALMGADGELTPDEIPPKLQIVLRPGSYTPAHDTDAPADSGPPWFYHNDVNRDGDVSWQEFLGNVRAFEQIDRDSDGLIDVHEALLFEAGTVAEQPAAASAP
jgi:Ca2+-binding EF-hand superfamily protein